MGVTMTAGERTAEPNGHRPRTVARVGRALAIGAALVLAAAGGFGGALGAAAVTARPAVFLTCGAAVTALLGGAGLWAALGNLPRVRRIWAVALLLGALELIGAVAVLTPTGGRTPAPVDGASFWRLETGSRLAYVRIPGVAPRRPTPVVVLHGGPGVPDMAGDAAYFGKLSKLGYDVYVYDQLGSGRSTRLADPAGYSVERDVADLDAVRRAIGAGRMILVGHSAGGALAAHYVAAHPDRVDRLVLSSPGPLDPSDTSGDRATAGLATGRRLRSYAAALEPRALLGYLLLQVDPAAAHAYLPDAEADARNDTILTTAEPALHCTPAQAHGGVRGTGFYRLQYPQSATASAPPDPRPALAGLPVPALIFKGSCDYLSWRSALDYRRVLPRSILVYLDGAGHNTYQDRPAEVLADITAFLTGRPLPVSAYPRQAAPPGYAGPR